MMQPAARERTLWIAFALLAASSSAAAQERLPIIDMHLHASSPDGFGGPRTVCTNREWVEFPPVDPRDEATVQKTSTCPNPLMSARDGEENARQTGEMMKRYNMYGVLDVSRDGEGVEVSLAHGDEWRRYAETIPVAIETIERAPFLTEEQKRDILYNNATRFLRLSQEEIDRHHGK